MQESCSLEPTIGLIAIFPQSMFIRNHDSWRDEDMLSWELHEQWADLDLQPGLNPQSSVDSEVHAYTDDTVQNIRTTQAPGTTLPSFQRNEGPGSDLGQSRVQ